MSNTKVGVPSHQYQYLKLVLKTPDKLKFEQQVVPDINGPELDQPHYTVKGRNACRAEICKQIQVITALARSKEHHNPEDIRHCLNEITFMIHIMNGNRLGAEKAYNKSKLHYSDLLNNAMFPSEKSKYKGSIKIDQYGNSTSLEVERDYMPEQKIIELGKDATDSNKCKDWCLKHLPIISKVW